MASPSRLNWATLLLALLLGGAGYWLWKFFPHYFTAYQVDHVLAEGAARSYRVSQVKGSEGARAKQDLIDDLRRQVTALGVVDPDMTLDIKFEGEQAIANCDYRAIVVHPLAGQFTVLPMHRSISGSLKPQF